MHCGAKHVCWQHQRHIMKCFVGVFFTKFSNFHENQPWPYRVAMRLIATLANVSNKASFQSGRYAAWRWKYFRLTEKVGGEKCLQTQQRVFVTTRFNEVDSVVLVYARFFTRSSPLIKSCEHRLKITITSILIISSPAAAIVGSSSSRLKPQWSCS